MEQVFTGGTRMAEPKPVLNIRMRQDLFQLLEDLANEEGKTKTEIVMEAIQLYARYLGGRETVTLNARVTQLEDQVQEILARLSLVEENQGPDPHLHPKVVRAMLELEIRDLDKATRDELRKICSRVGIPRDHYMSLKVDELRESVYTFPDSNGA